MPAEVIAITYKSVCLLVPTLSKMQLDVDR